MLAIIGGGSWGTALACVLAPRFDVVIGAIDAACRVYSEAVQHHPDHPTGHVNLANLLYRANKHVEARAHYEAALRIDPTTSRLTRDWAPCSPISANATARDVISRRVFAAMRSRACRIVAPNLR